MKSIPTENSISISFFSTSATESPRASFMEGAYAKVEFSVSASTQYKEEVAVIGNCKELGAWDINLAVPLTTSKLTYPVWTSKSIFFSNPTFPIVLEYKYIIFKNKSNEIVWESFTKNRRAIIRDRASFYYSFKISNLFNHYEKMNLKICSDSKIVKAVTNAVAQGSLDQQVAFFINILQTEPVDATLLQLLQTSLNYLKIENNNEFKPLYTFVEWCCSHLSHQQTKLLLYGIDYTYVELSNLSETLNRKLESYELAWENLDDDLVISLKLSELRNELFYESRQNIDIISLLFADSNLAKREIFVLERIINNIAYKGIWKIGFVGKWISEMFLFDCINTHEAFIIKTQFEKMDKAENLEIMRDLLYEMLEMVLDLYIGLKNNTRHEECEALAHDLGEDYRLVYSELFQICSQFILKAIPYINKKLHLGSHISYSSGTCQGFMWKHSSIDSKSFDRIILNVHDPSEFFELDSRTVGVVANSIKSIFIPLLVQARE